MKTIAFKDFLKELSASFTPVVSTKFKVEEYIAIDLSESNKDLTTIDVSSSEAFEGYISKYVAMHKAKVAFGGYNEIRSIYRRSSHFNKQDPETERNIHLGIDVWCAAQTDIKAVLDGTIHSFKNNQNFGDYGPTIILEHNTQGFTFYTLYGHLSVESLAGKQVGQKIKQGQVIAVLGDASVNGDYAPHLHFQVIKDIQGNFGDYPGVSNQKDLEFYLQNCPDPNLLLKIV